MIQRTTRDYEVSLWTLQDSFLAILKQYGLEYKGQIENGKFSARDDGTETFSFSIPMYYYSDGQRIPNPSWYNVTSGALLANMRKIKLIFNKDNIDKKVYEFLIVKVTEQHKDDNSLYCSVECQGLAFHELGKIGYKISLTPDDFYNDDYDWATTGQWYNVKTASYDTTQPLATLNYWNDKVFNTINNWDYKICMNWKSYSLWEDEAIGVLQDYTTVNDIITTRKPRETGKVYEDDFIDSWELKNNDLVPKHVTSAREKARVSINISDSNIYNITQELAEIFGVFCRYEYEYDSSFHIIGRHVVYYNNFLAEEDETIDINYPYQTNSIKREIDSTDLVTKLFVKSIEDNSGLLSIIDVGANKSQEDYILNFDYLYSIGGITKEQYDQVNNYIIKIRTLNEQIAPISAKVISLQSQLTKVEAELTTKKNAIALDTEQLLANTALLNSITNGDEVLSVSETNPQTAVLIQDTTESRVNSYYVKITQKGVYPETIRLFKKYSYQTSRLEDEDEIKTGIVVFDDAGEVIRVNNIFLQDPAHDPKTVYITYDYRPKLFYDRIVTMWENRLNQDTISKDKLEEELAQLNYSLYGSESKYSLRNINVANLLQFNVYNRYQNLLKQKQKTIKEFNAMLGPAIRQGYWQPENYSDYGDKYNDKFLIQLNNTIPVSGTTNNSQFVWDDEIFEGEQELYYKYTAAEYEQAYPCIDLSTQHGMQILRMMADHPDLPISFIYKPTTSQETDARPRHVPSFASFSDSITVIPGLYSWVNETGPEIEFNNDNLSKIPETIQNKIIQMGSRYNGLLDWYMSQGWKEGYTRYSWAIDNQEISDVSNTNNRYRSLPNVENVSYEYQLQLLSTVAESFIGKKIKLSAFNTGIREGSTSYVETTVKTLNENIVTRSANSLQLNLQNDTNGSFIASYQITNDSEYDKQLNYYIWTIGNIKDTSGGNLTSNQIFLEYSEGEIPESGSITLNNNKVLNYTVTINDNVHTVTFTNNNNIFNDIKLNETFTVNLTIKNPNDFIQDTAGITYDNYNFIVSTKKPFIQDTTEQDITSITLFTDNNEFNLIMQTRVAQEAYNNGLQAYWEYKDNQNNWQPLNLNNTIFDMSTITALDTNDKRVMRSITKISVKSGKEQDACNIIQDMAIRARIGKNDSDTDNDSDYKYFDLLHIIIPINVKDEDIVQLMQPINLAPAFFGQSGRNYTEYTITIAAEHATRYIWNILPGDTQQLIELEVDNTTNTVSYSSDRYTVQKTAEGSNFTIRIPLFSEQDSTRDNNTQISCVCTNASGNTIYLPFDKNNELLYQTITVKAPISIQFIKNSDWWAVNPVKTELLETVRIKTYKSIVNDYKLTMEVSGAPIKILKKISQNETEDIAAANIQNLFNYTFTSDIDESDSLEVNYNYLQAVTANSNIFNVKYNNQNIIDFSSTSNDKQYMIQYGIEIKIYNDNALIYDQIHTRNVDIRQNVPESEYFINDNSADDFIEVTYINDIKYVSNTLDPVAQALADGVQETIGANTGSSTSGTKLLKFQLRIDMNNYINANSTTDVEWACYPIGENQGLTCIPWDNTSSYYQPDIKVSAQILTIQYPKSQQYANKGDIAHVGVEGYTQYSTYVSGLDKQLYIKFKNNWSNAYLNTKRFKFTGHSSKGGDN